MFGIFIMDSYRSLMKRNWDFRFGKFENAIKSWSPRMLETTLQRVEVVKVFALSRIYYVASILPINKTMVNKIEKVIGQFIWKKAGKVLRVSIQDLKNSVDKGGLGLPCILSRSKALMVSQLVRLLKSGDAKSLGHVGYWLGELLSDLMPGFDDGDHAVDVPPYYDYFAHLMVEVMTSEVVSCSTWRTVTCKTIYLKFSESFPKPRIEVEAGIFYQQLWKRLSLPLHSVISRDVLYLLVHNKLPVRERIFRIGLRVDPYCGQCPGGEICDLEHFFCSCLRVANVWGWVRRCLEG